MDNTSLIRLSGLILTFLFFWINTQCQPNDPGFKFENKDYSKYIGQSYFSPSEETESTAHLDPVMSLGVPISFHFDIFGEDYQFLNAKLIHCDFDWQKSTLNEMDFLKTRNELPIENYYFSSNTLSLFTHYSFTLPDVSKSGNYLLLIYEDDQDQSPIMSRRIIVYENLISVNTSVLVSNHIQNRNSHQRIVTELRHDRLNILNPYNDLKIALLQNHNWQNTISNLLPTKSRIDQKYVAYDHFSGENEFSGLNEMRFFDISTTDYRGERVEVIFKEKDHLKARIDRDKKRSDQSYSGLYSDRNGGFIIDNRNPGGIIEEADYVEVLFQLVTEKLEEEVYVVGKFNNWAQKEQNRMRYDADRKMYLSVLRLKQGFYDYRYVAKTEKNHSFEGNFHQTKNEYEVLVYYREAFKNYDQIVGYSKILSGN